MDFSKGNMYADDTNTTIGSKDKKELIRMTKKELLNISGWFRAKKTKCKPPKTEFKVIVHQRRINEIGPHLIKPSLWVSLSMKG